MTETSTDTSSSHEAGAVRRAAWLSKGFEVLVAELAAKQLARAGEFDFEVVVIGSGYGGAVAAAELSRGLRDGRFDGRAGVCVLERGREYLQGMFPTRLSEIADHVRFSSAKTTPRGQRTGLLDFRLSAHVNALVANGLGGGSLINAGVMAAPRPYVMQQPAWPQPIRDANMAPWFDEARRRVGARRDGVDNHLPDGEALAKHETLKSLGRASFKKVALTIAFENKLSAGGVPLNRCARCGDCATGCNHGAKESLDTNLLVQAAARGARIYCGATVLHLRKRPGGDGWEIHANHTDDKLRRRQTEPVIISARKIVLAAGTLGSTEILLRSSRASGLTLSPRLGKGFSANGDMLATLSGLTHDANCIADEATAPNARAVGPTITGMIDERPNGPPTANTLQPIDVVVQDIAVPGPLRRLFEQGLAMSEAFDTLSIGDEREHLPSDADPCAIDESATQRALVVAMIGHDSADGELELVTDPAAASDDSASGDGALRIVWPTANQDARLDARQKRVQGLQNESHVGGRTLANPMWRVLPARLESLFGDARGPMLTVHPLGGCSMADDASRGVVDHLGRVFSGSPDQPTDVHDGLVVLDGSIIPTSLGINPSLSITALALRAVAELLRTFWASLAPLPAAAAPAAALPDWLRQRPIFRRIDVAATPAPTKPTRIELVERMSGEVCLPGSGELLHAELTLQFRPREVAKLMHRRSELRQLEVDPTRSRLRLFEPAQWQQAQTFPHEEPPDKLAFWIAPIEHGALRIFRREESSARDRRWRATGAWFLNRGWRDSMQVLIARLFGAKKPGEPSIPLQKLVCDRIASTIKLTSLAGEVRLFEYDLTLAKPTKADPRLVLLGGQRRLIGTKRITYNRRGNPWRQMMELSLDRAPFQAPSGEPARLELDLRFLARREVALLRVVDQEDQVTALIDLASYALYLMRILLRVHTWSFRKPDDPPTRRVTRLPRALPDMPQPKRYCLTVAIRSPAPRPKLVKILLTRYPNKPGSHGRPVLMIHGYSASGTTFAHRATPSLARHLWERGWDAWIVDLRTSAGMPTAREPWSFEQVADTDIPLAVEHICKITGHPTIDVVAHCMGSAMLSMALLGDTAVDDTSPSRQRLRTRIHRLVMSQVTPITLFSPTNVFRAFVMRYVREYLDLDGYAFRVDKPSFGDQLLDRFLATLPYPDGEFDRENPPFPSWRSTPWTGTRHRMDALYGRDFSLLNVSDEMLEVIDDHFGPLSIETVSQAIHFARSRHLTDKLGNNRYVTPPRVRRNLTFDTLSIHGVDNGLADVATGNYMDQLFRESLAQGTFEREIKPIVDHGHQDSLIGVSAPRDVFPLISDFLGKVP